jgi:hypothetical protein
LSRERIEISMPPAGKLALFGAGGLLVAMVALLIGVLAVLADSREHIVAQDRKIDRIVKGTDPILDEVKPVAGDARGLLRQATPFVRDLRALIPTAVTAADLVPELRRLLAETLEVQRETLLTQRTTLATQRETLRAQRETLAIQRESRDIQRQTLALFQRSLTVQEEALVHVRSIDSKTGGPAPTVAPVPTR